MDFLKFNLPKKYTKNFVEYEILFDFDLREITNHNKKTFDDYKSLLFFLENNKDRKLFITLTQTEGSFEEGEKIVINLRSYQEFCKKIGQTGENRTQAFLAKKIKHYSDDERKDAIASSTPQEITQGIKDFTEQQKNELVKANATDKNIIEAFKNIDPASKQKILEAIKEFDNDSGLVVTDKNKEQVFKQILDKNYSEEFWGLINNLKPEDTKRLSATFKQKEYQTELENLKQLIKLEEETDIVEEIKKHDNLKTYIAGQPEKIFQNWIEANQWVFGVEYIKKHDARQIALFSQGDLLMESIDGFLDLIELKRPKLKYDIFNYDESHKSYYPSSHLSEVIGQCLFYLQKMDDTKLVLEKEYKVKILRPRIKIILGRTNTFNEQQFLALRMLNSNLHHIQVVSYDYILDCGEKIISLFKN